MGRRFLVGLGLALIAAFAAGLFALSDISTVAVPARTATDLAASEQAATVAQMKPPKRIHPVIAVVGQNDGTETTDFLVPYAVLKRANVAEVTALGTRAGRMQLMPALAIEPEATIAEFDRLHPEGADYVIVPALHRHDDRDVVAFIREQSAKGAVVVGICSGVRTVSAAGLLAGRSATGHWYDTDDLQSANPTMRRIPDRRYVVDHGVVTTTGVSASLPVSLALVEAIAGRARAQEVARDLGVEAWDARHDSSAFVLSGAMKRIAAVNTLSFWRHDSFGILVTDGVDDVALAFEADAWSRTYRSRALAIGEGPALRTGSGLRLLPDRSLDEGAGLAMLPMPASAAPAQALPSALAAIAEHFGEATADFVALQLEYPWQRPQ
jgi:transcriptional regulator GlxA family with amidase domain